VNVATPPATPTPRSARDLRLFVALWPTPAVRAALHERRDAIRWPRSAAVVSDDRLHLTLHFIGSVPRTSLPHLMQALQLPCRSSELELGPALHWPRGLVVLPAAAVPAPLLALHAALAGVLAGLGLPVEPRAFRPHVTLARRAAGAVLPPPAPPLHWRASSYALVSSDPTDGYRVLARYGERGIRRSPAPRTATAQSWPAPAPTSR
jgi:2'-5' RNA ligase